MSTPLYRQIADDILKKINAGEFNEKLPAIRVLAKNFCVNNSTIVSAYKFLEQKREIYSVVGSGTFIAKKNDPPTLNITDDCINFASSATDVFPADDFRAAFDAVIARDGAGAFAYPGWRGYAPLREAIAQMINEKADNIQIISDIRQGFNLVLDALISQGDAVVLESPTVEWAAADIISRGAKIFHRRDIKKIKPKIFFLSSTFQTPTGLCYTEKEKTYILKLAVESGAYIIETDDYGDFFYHTPPLSLKAMDTARRVIYLKSFDRVLTQGLAGYIACPEEIINRLRDSEVNGCTQRALHFYLRNFDFAAHLSKIRAEYFRKFKRAVAAAEAFLSPYAEVTVPDGGLSIWVKADADYSNEFFKQKVLVSPGKLFSQKTAHHFRINFASVSDDDISKGIGIIASVLKLHRNN
jgi:DNA-binding transcriptional MocR family regulator